MKYSKYSVNDFVLDEYFQSWVFSIDDGVHSFWEAWLESHPEKHTEIDEARRILKAVRFSNHTLSAPELATLWTKIQQPGNAQRGEMASGTSARYWVRGMAAAILFSIVAAVYMFSNDKPFKQYQTAFGETSNLVLPDGSTVVLNANSTLTLYSDWKGAASREIWLDGEAFFSVVHKTNNQPFKVNTEEGVTVEVLGTTFNVYNRTNSTKVVLNSGQIRLNLPLAQSPETILMKPGEMVEYKEKRYNKKEVNPQLYTAWTSNKIILDHTSLDDMVHMLKDSYGLDVNVGDPRLLEQTVSGSMPLGDAEILLAQLAKAFQLKIVKEGNVITVAEIK